MARNRAEMKAILENFTSTRQFGDRHRGTSLGIATLHSIGIAVGQEPARLERVLLCSPDYRSCPNS